MTTTYTNSYTTVGEIQSAYPPITSVTALTSAVISQAFIGGVEAEINGKISKRYSLPLALPAPLLSAIALRESIYRISMSRLMSSVPSAQTGRATVTILHEADQKLLEEIANGDVQLLDNSMQVIAADIGQTEIYSTTMNFNPTFHEGPWVNQVQDWDKLDAILDERQGRGLSGTDPSQL